MKAALFDLDGTLLFKRPTVAEKWYEQLCSAGYTITEDDTQLAFARCESWVGRQIQLENKTGIQLSDQEFMTGVITCGLDSLGLGNEAFNLLADVWAGKYQKTYSAADSVHSVLDSLRSRDIALGVVSNNYSSIRDVLTSLDLTGYFSEIIISEEVGLYKPDPQILLYACKLMSIKPCDAIYIGDHPFDVVCAANAGLYSAWIPVNRYMQLPPASSNPDYRLNSITELNNIL